MSDSLPLYRDGKAFYLDLTFWIENGKLMAKEEHSAPYVVDWIYVEDEYMEAFRQIEATLKVKYPDSQIITAFQEWPNASDGKAAGVRFGQWFCNHHPEIRQDSTLWNLENPKEALVYLLNHYSL